MFNKHTHTVLKVWEPREHISGSMLLLQCVCVCVCVFVCACHSRSCLNKLNLLECVAVNIADSGIKHKTNVYLLDLSVCLSGEVCQHWRTGCHQGH